MIRFQKMARPLATLAIIAVTAALALRSLDVGEFEAALRQARWGFLIPSTLLNLLIVGFIVTRWKTLLDHRVRFLDVMSANQIGALVNTLLPLRMGDFTRSYLLRRRVPGLSMVAILSSIGAELTFDMIVLMLLLASVLVVLPLPGLLASAGALLAVLTVIAAVGLLSLARSDWLVETVIRRLIPHQFAPLVMGLIGRMRDGLRSLRSNRQLANLLALTIGSYAIQIAADWILLHVFLDDVPLHAGLVAQVGVGIGLALPLLPSSAGTFELAVALALSGLGISPEEAAAFALVLHGQQVIMTVITGGGFMLREGVSIHELREAAHQTPV